jgi:hypothetical protein
MMWRVNALEELSVDELVGQYRAAASKHGEATLRGTPRVANRNADVVAAVYRELRRRGDERALSALLDDDDRGVRGWAGAHALEFAPSEGESVLEILAAEDFGLVSFSAEITLEEWRAGRLRFP